MNPKDGKNALKIYLADWIFISEHLKYSRATDIATWACRWTDAKDFDPAFLLHNGVLKTFSWFVVDNAKPEIPLQNRAEAKTAVFDILDDVLALDDMKTLCRESCITVDWLKTRSRLESSLADYRGRR